MFQLKTDFEFLFIGEEREGFAKNYAYEWDDGLGKQQVKLFMNLEILSNEIPAEEVGEEIFETIKNHFFLDLEKDPYSRFEETLKEINSRIREKEQEYEVRFTPNINVVVAAICNEQLYLSARGDAEVYLVRKKHLSVISEGLFSPETSQKEFFSNIANGVLEPGDKIIFSSTRLLRYVTKSDLARIFSENDLKDALPELSNLIEVEVLERISVLGVEIKGLRAEAGARLEEGGEEKKTPVPLFASFSRFLNENKLTQFILKKLTDWQYALTKHEKFAFLKEWRRLGRDKILIALVLVVVILIGGIYLVRSQGKKQKYLAELEAALEQIEIDVNTAETKGSYDKEKAAELLKEAETKALQVLNSGYLRAKATQYLNKIQEQKDYLDNVTRITEPTVLADLSTKRTTVSALGLVPFSGHLFAFEYNALYEVILDQVQDPLTIDETEVVIAGDYFEDRDSLVFLTQSGRVIEYKDKNFSFLDTLDGVWKSGTDLLTYNNKIYLFDPINNQIWRYASLREGFSGAEAYNLNAVDISAGKSFTIDANIYILKEDGSIIKFYSGEQVDFVVKKMPLTSWAGAAKLYTEYEMSQIFILDSGGSRVIVLNKDARTGNAVYSHQYVLENVEELKDLYVRKTDNKLYVLGKTKIYEINLGA